MRMFLRMKCENFVLVAEIPCEWKFATKFASECECDGLVHSGSDHRGNSFRNGPNAVSESTVSNAELSEFFGPHQVPGTELGEFLSAYYLCAKANSQSFSRNSPSLPQNSASSLFRNLGHTNLGNIACRQVTTSRGLACNLGLAKTYKMGLS